MRVVNVFDAVKDGTYEEFLHFYDGDVNQINKYSGLNLLETALTNDKNQEDKKKIILHLISEGVDIDYVDPKYKRNALHHLFFDVMRSSKEYFFEVASILIRSGVRINQTDKYGAIPLDYAITVNKLSTDDMRETYKLLIKSGSDVYLKNKFNKSCLDYAQEFSWRNGFVDLLKEEIDD